MELPSVKADAQDSTIAIGIRDFIATDLLFSPNGFPYDDTTLFLDEGIVDSLGVMELVGFVQKSFGMNVEEDEVIPENFGSVALLTDFVRRKQGASAPIS